MPQYIDFKWKSQFWADSNNSQGLELIYCREVGFGRRKDRSSIGDPHEAAIIPSSFRDLLAESRILNHRTSICEGISALRRSRRSRGALPAGTRIPYPCSQVVLGNTGILGSLAPERGRRYQVQLGNEGKKSRLIDYSSSIRYFSRIFSTSLSIFSISELFRCKSKEAISFIDQ